MASGTVNIGGLQRMGQLQEQAVGLENEIGEKTQELSGVMAEIRDLADSMADGTPVANVTRRGPQASNANANANGPRRGPGRPKGSGKVAPVGRRGKSTNERPLRQVVWETVSQKPAALRKFLPDLPANVTGLKVAEIRDVIESQKLWTSDSKSLGPQIQQHVHKLKKQGKFVRGDDKRYSVAKGATLE